jgi:hypothetical protein
MAFASFFGHELFLYVTNVLRHLFAQAMDNFRRGLHNFFVTGPKMLQLH